MNANNNKKPTQHNGHNDHYQAMDIEPVDVQTVMMGEAMPVYCVAQSIKYLMRAGLKNGESFTKDLEKAENWIHRAKTGEWLSPK